MNRFILKIVLMTACFSVITVSLAGCKSNDTTDNADNETITQGEDIGVPPVPPEPTRPAQ